MEKAPFYRLPKAQLDDPALSLEAKVLYALLLDRRDLSMRSGWTDREGEVFVYFTLEEARLRLGRGRNKAAAAFAQLEAGGLIRRRRQGQGKPHRIYVTARPETQEETPEELPEVISAQARRLPDEAPSEIPEDNLPVHIPRRSTAEIQAAIRAELRGETPSETLSETPKPENNLLVHIPRRSTAEIQAAIRAELRGETPAQAPSETPKPEDNLLAHIPRRSTAAIRAELPEVIPEEAPAQAPSQATSEIPAETLSETLSEIPLPNLRTAQERKPKLPDTGSLNSPQRDPNHTEKNHNKKNHTEGNKINPPPSPPQKKGEGPLDLIREILRDNTGYQGLAYAFPWDRPLFDRYIDLMCRACDPENSTVLGQPAGEVRQRLFHLSREDLLYVRDRLPRECGDEEALAALCAAPARLEALNAV